MTCGSELHKLISLSVNYFLFCSESTVHQFNLWPSRCNITWGEKALYHFSPAHAEFYKCIALPPSVIFSLNLKAPKRLKFFSLGRCLNPLIIPVALVKSYNTLSETPLEQCTVFQTQSHHRFTKGHILFPTPSLIIRNFKSSPVLSWNVNIRSASTLQLWIGWQLRSNTDKNCRESPKCTNHFRFQHLFGWHIFMMDQIKKTLKALIQLFIFQSFHMLMKTEL